MFLHYVTFVLLMLHNFYNQCNMLSYAICMLSSFSMLKRNKRHEKVLVKLTISSFTRFFEFTKNEDELKGKLQNCRYLIKNQVRNDFDIMFLGYYQTFSEKFCLQSWFYLYDRLTVTKQDSLLQFLLTYHKHLVLEDFTSILNKLTINKLDAGGLAKLAQDFLVCWHL